MLSAEIKTKGKYNGEISLVLEKGVWVSMIENVTNIEKKDLIDEIKKTKDDGYRFVTASCVDMGSQFMIYYHFDKNNDMKHLKVIIDKDEEVPSISGVYFSGVLVENEMKDLFGMKITDLAIDYEGKFLITGDVGMAPQAIQIAQTENKGGM